MLTAAMILHTALTRCLYNTVQSMDRSLLEYASTVWNLHYENLINSIETVQMRATKVVITVKHLPYSERIQALQLTT